MYIYLPDKISLSEAVKNTRSKAAQDPTASNIILRKHSTNRNKWLDSALLPSLSLQITILFLSDLFNQKEQLPLKCLYHRARQQEATLAWVCFFLFSG